MNLMLASHVGSNRIVPTPLQIKLISLGCKLFENIFVVLDGLNDISMMAQLDFFNFTHFFFFIRSGLPRAPYEVPRDILDVSRNNMLSRSGSPADVPGTLTEDRL